MKKFITLFLLVSILVLSVSNSFAQASAKPAAVHMEIKYVQNGAWDFISIYSSDYSAFNVFNLSDPERIVVDIPGNLVPVNGLQTILINSSRLKSIRYSQFSENTARVVFDIKGEPSCRIEQEDGCLSFIFSDQVQAGSDITNKPDTSRGDVQRPAVNSDEKDDGKDNSTTPEEGSSLKNVAYSHNGDTASLVLKDAKLEEMVKAASSKGSVDGTTDENARFKPLYSQTLEASGKKLTLSFPASLADLENGKLEINDEILESVEISYDKKSRKTLVSLNSRDSMIYDVTYNPQTNDTEIHILKHHTKTEKLVVIDAGHGGHDSGAAYAGIQEKELNLKIALKVDEILREKGIKTHMTRKDDTFVPLHDRADIANDLNAALFLSIHNNSYNVSENGTETLYFPGEKGSQLAGIIQNSLVNALGTHNRGIKERPNLVVLNATKMPAVIAEVAFITNTEDRQNLTQEAFLDKAAQALVDSVVKALDTLDLD